jgi:hypothetical protein
MPNFTGGGYYQRHRGKFDLCFSILLFLFILGVFGYIEHRNTNNMTKGITEMDEVTEERIYTKIMVKNPSVTYEIDLSDENLDICDNYIRHEGKWRCAVQKVSPPIYEKKLIGSVKSNCETFVIYEDKPHCVKYKDQTSTQK